MITSNGTIRSWITAPIFIALIASTISSASAVENRLRSERSSASKKQSVDAKHRPSRSMVAQAATGRIPGGIPEAPLDGSLIGEEVSQVGYLDGCSNGCGVCCDCGIGASCGAEGIMIDDPACGIEPGCGIEVGCGIGHAIEMMGPACGIEACGCGVSDCDGGCAGMGEIACGIETIIDGPACGIGGCDGACDGGCDSCGSCDVGKIPLFLPFLRVQWCRFDFFAGVQGFKGPMNFANISANDPNVQGGSGSFGFYQGFNEGRSLKRWLGWDLAAQLGVRATQSNLSGSELTEETRTQVFLTGGFFRRVDYGLQYGTVLDYMNDDWWFQSHLLQSRSELSWKTMGCHAFGVQYMTSLGSDTSTTNVRDINGNIVESSVTFESTDQYRIFYRRLLNSSGDWTSFAGWTDKDDGLLGTSLNLPLRRKWLLATSATFLIPREGDSSGGNRNEGWNISMGIVYRPGGPNGCGRYCRPMFDVADNGTFLIDQK